MMKLVIVLTVLGIAGLHALATWFGHSAMVVFWLTLPVVVGRCGLAVWELVQRRANQTIDARVTDRWVKWLTIAYFVGACVAATITEFYRVPSAPHTEPPQVAEADREQVAEADRELLTGCQVRRGDSVEQVKALYGITAAPQKLTTITPGGTAYQYHFEQFGLWVFFDDRRLVTSVRADAPFRGRFQGVGIGDNSGMVGAVKGPPARRFQGVPVAVGGGVLEYTTALVYDPGTPSFVRYDLLGGKVWSIIANSCPLLKERGALGAGSTRNSGT